MAQTPGEPRRTRVDLLGRYLIRGLAPGEYTITVLALGYTPARLELHLAPSSAADISVGLQHQPFYLEHVDITGERARSSTFTGTGDDTRTLLELDRQRRFPSSDARILTFGDVTKSIAPVQPDLLRAIQALPGVSGRDDYSAELWTRGSPWSQTRVTFDGLPLYNPLHAAGAMSAISLDGLGEVVFHPGVQPSGPSQGVAGRVALTSRPGSPTQRRGSTELSILSGGLSMEGTAGGRTAYTFAARRSHIDLWSRALGVAGDDNTGGVPYVFSDAILRIDHSLSDQWKLSTSGIVASDQLNGSIDDIVYADHARWGSLGARTSLTVHTERGSLEHTIGASGFAATGNPPRGTGAGQDI